MKKFLLIVFYVCFSFILTACETQTQVRCAYISDMTAALSAKHSVKVVLDDDERVNDKFVDVQIKSNKENQFLQFGEENHQSYSLFLPKADYWYNLTYLISQTNGAAGEAGYEVYHDYGNKVFNLTSKNDVDLTFRVVVGQVKENVESGEQILVLSESVSKEVQISVKADKE